MDYLLLSCLFRQMIKTIILLLLGIPANIKIRQL